MSNYIILLNIFVALVAGWMLYRIMQHRPGQFTEKSLQDASFTLGLLAVGLILLISFFVITL